MTSLTTSRYHIIYKPVQATSNVETKPSPELTPNYSVITLAILGKATGFHVRKSKLKIATDIPDWIFFFKAKEKENVPKITRGCGGVMMKMCQMKKKRRFHRLVEIAPNTTRPKISQAKISLSPYFVLFFKALTFFLATRFISLLSAVRLFFLRILFRFKRRRQNSANRKWPSAAEAGKTQM